MEKQCQTLFFGGSKITADGDCSHEIKRCLLLGRKVMTNLDSMSSSNSCFLTCIWVSKEACQIIWYSHPLQNSPQFVMVHTVKGFGIVNKAEVDVFLEFSCFFDDLMDVGNLISGSFVFPKSSLNIWKFMVHVCIEA